MAMTLSRDAIRQVPSHSKSACSFNHDDQFQPKFVWGAELSRHAEVVEYWLPAPAIDPAPHANVLLDHCGPQLAQGHVCRETSQCWPVRSLGPFEEAAGKAASYSLYFVLCHQPSDGLLIVELKELN
jgi:hypothetical protein